MSESLSRAAILGLPLYVPDSGACEVDLSDNTNLWGTPPAARSAVAETPGATMSRYPSAYSEPLHDAILGYLGVGRSSGVHVVTGCGSDDVLDSTMRAFGEPGDSIAYSVPTFSMIPVLARLNGLVPQEIPLTAAFDVDAEQLVDCGAKVTYLCSPNNPTATSISRSAVEYVVQRAQGIVLLDEAYAEFAPEVFTDLLAQHERLIIARTFSKAFGLAGLRVGYAASAGVTARIVEKARGPYKVTSLAERAVLAALGPSDGGLPWVRRHAAMAIENRSRLAAALAALGLPTIPSDASFVLAPTANAVALGTALRENGVLVRSFTGLSQDIPAFAASRGAALRIGVGPWEMMETLLTKLGQVL